MAMLTYRQLCIVGEVLLKSKQFYVHGVHNALMEIQERLAKDEASRRVEQAMSDILDASQNQE